MTSNDKKHVVYSNGFALSEFDYAEVVASLSELYKIPEQQVTKRLLGGKSAKIKSFKELAGAEKLVARLTRRGLNCYVLSPDMDDIEDIDAGAEQPSTASIMIPDSEYELSGVVSEIEDITDKLNLAQSSNPDIDSQTRPKSWLKWAMALVILLSLAISAYVLVGKWLQGSVPPSVKAVERALFNSQKPSGVLYGDLAQMRRLLSLADDVQLSEKTNSVINRVPLLSHLSTNSTAGEPPRDLPPLLVATDVFNASFALNSATPVSGTETAPSGPSLLTVLQGDYSGLDVRQELAKYYVLEPMSEGLLSLRPKAQANAAASECVADEAVVGQKSVSLIYASLGTDQIILASSPAAIRAFNAAFVSGADGELQSGGDENNKLFSQWQDYRLGSLFAFSLFDDRLLQQDFIANAASRALFGESKFESIAVRAMAVPLKQSLTVSFDAKLNDAAVAREAASKIQTGIDDLGTQNKDVYPAVVSLLSRIDVSADQTLRLALSLDKQVAGELETLVSDFFSMMFSPSSNSSGDGNELVADELDENAWDYSLNTAVFSASEPKPDQFTKFLPLASEGSVEIYLQSVGMKATSPFDESLGQTLQLAIQAKRPAPFGDAFFGWSDSGIKQSLSITEVTDEAGNNLLSDERCSKAHSFYKRNHEPNDSANYTNGVIETSKTVRLISSASIQNIASIRGRYHLIAPVSVAARTITPTNSVVEWPGGSLTLISVENGRVSYLLRGDESPLLQVRGLNAQGQPLKSSGGFSSGSRHTKEFRGKVASVELMIAEEFQEQSFDFSTDRVFPRRANAEGNAVRALPPREPVVFIKSQAAKFDKPVALQALTEQERESIADTLRWQGFSLDASEDNELGLVSVGAAVVFFSHNAQAQWGHKLHGAVILPHDVSLHGNRKAVQLALELDGEPAQTIDVLISPNVLNGDVLPTLKLRGADYDVGFFKLSFDEQQPPFKEISGQLIYNLPIAIDRQAVVLADADNISLQGYEFGWQSNVTYELDGAAAEAFFATVTQNNGEIVAGEINNDEAKVTLTFADLSDVTALQSVTLYSVSDSLTERESFNFTPVYK